MAKIKDVFVCSDCGSQVSQWQGQCPHCQSWNSLSQRAVIKSESKTFLASAHPTVLLSEVTVHKMARFSSGMIEFDRVLGGGFVPQSVVLLGGDPGIGKSTLLLQAVAHLGKNHSVLYVSGEESAEQISARAQRIVRADSPVVLLPETRLEAIIAVALQKKPQLMVVDSIQTVVTDALDSAAGSVSQVRECAAKLTRLAKEGGPTIILVGHVTKEGQLAGPRVLEHMVDTVLYFEGETHSSYRMIRAIKNRFGAVNELALFAMTETGLKGVSNPSALFLSHYDQPVSGSCITATLEGTRPLLVEIQALLDDNRFGSPRRLSIGLDQNRLALLLAVLHRHGGVACQDQDVFVNAVAGMRIVEPASDLAVLAAIVSSLRNRPLDRNRVIFGEIGLAGEIRPVQRGQERLKEAAKLGFTEALIPKANNPKIAIEGLHIVVVNRIDEALSYLF